MKSFNKVLLTGILMATATLTACDKSAKKTPEQAAAEAMAYHDQAYEKFLTLVSDTPKFQAVLNDLKKHPELEGAEISLASIAIQLHHSEIDVYLRHSKTEKLQSYTYNTIEEKWGNGVPVKVVGIKAKDQDVESSPFDTSLPDTAMALSKAQEVFKGIPKNETFKKFTKIQYSAPLKYYEISTELSTPSQNIYSITLNEKGDVIKKNW